MDLSRNPLWDERGEFRRGCTVGEALSWLTPSGFTKLGGSSMARTAPLWQTSPSPRSVTATTID